MKLLAPQIYTSYGFVKEDVLNGKKALDVGCGSRKLPGAIGLDIVPSSAVDFVHNIAQTPWPFNDNEFDVVFMNHSLEHVVDVLDTLSEVHRISKNGARIVIQVPHFRCLDAYVDPTHRHFFTSRSLDYFIEGENYTKYNYIPARFKKLGFWYGWPHKSKNPLRQMIKNFTHRFPDFYDMYLSHLFPTECLTWELEVIKSKK